jgi:hypothetical protein
LDSTNGEISMTKSSENKVLGAGQRIVDTLLDNRGTIISYESDTDSYKIIFDRDVKLHTKESGYVSKYFTLLADSVDIDNEFLAQLLDKENIESRFEFQDRYIRGMEIYSADELKVGMYRKNIHTGEVCRINRIPRGKNIIEMIYPSMEEPLVGPKSWTISHP